LSCHKYFIHVCARLNLNQHDAAEILAHLIDRLEVEDKGVVRDLFGGQLCQRIEFEKAKAPNTSSTLIPFCGPWAVEIPERYRQGASLYISFQLIYVCVCIYRFIYAIVYFVCVCVLILFPLGDTLAAVFLFFCAQWEGNEKNV
jgi:hypothetical protein